MKRFLYISSAFSAGFFCWAVFTVNAAFSAEPAHNVGHVADSHGGGHGEASSAGLPQLDATTFPSQLFWLLVTFAVLYFIFSKKSLPDISGVIENRQQHVQDDLENAEKLRSEAEQAEKEYEESLQMAREASTKAFQDVQNKIATKSEKQTDAFREKADKDIRELESRLETAKKEAMDDMNTIAAEVASEAAKKIVGLNTDLEQAKTVVKALNGTNAKAA